MSNVHPTWASNRSAIFYSFLVLLLMVLTVAIGARWWRVIIVAVEVPLLACMWYGQGRASSR